MPQNIGSAEGAFFNTLIPQIDENADIQTAFRLYHYGENNSGSKPLNPNSIAGYLDALNEGKIEKVPDQIPISADLNDYTDPGFYIQTSNARAQTGTNYPKTPPLIGLEYAGILRVISDGTNVFQEYQVGGIPNGRTFWRTKFGALDFYPWTTYAVDGHVHDDRYFTQQQSDDRYLPEIRRVNVREANVQNDEYTLTALDETALVMVDNFSLPNTLYVPNDSNVNFQTGAQITILQKNIGQVTILGKAGVTINSTPGNRLRAIWSSASLIKIGPNEWVMVGDLA